MQITISNIDCKIHHASYKEIQYLKKLLSFKIDGAEYSKYYTGWCQIYGNKSRSLANCRKRKQGCENCRMWREGKWDGTKKLLNLSRLTFPTGFLPHMKNQLEKKDFDIEIKEDIRGVIKRKKLLTLKNINPPLRTHQKVAIKKIVKNRLDGIKWPRGLISHCTGSGKTLTEAGLIYLYSKHKVLILVQSLDLLNQLSDVYVNALNKSIGKVGGGLFDLQNITVAMIQTLHSKLKSKEISNYLQSVEVVLIDESHFVGDNRYNKVLRLLVNASVRVGFSGTNLLDNAVNNAFLIANLGDELHKVKSKVLAKKGLVAKVRVNLYDITEPNHRKSFLDYPKLYDLCLMNNEIRNMKIVELVELSVKARIPTLVLVEKLKHGRTLLNLLLEKDGFKYLKGEDSMEERKMITLNFKKSEVPLIIASVIFDVGVDLPNLKHLILAGGGKSARRTIQRVGRGMRTKKGDNTLIVSDFLDRTCKYLYKHSKKRIETFKTEGYKIYLNNKRL